MKNTPQNWIFLRGLARETEHWGSFLQAFEKQVSRSKATAVDLPGTGVYCHLQSPTTLNGLVDFVRSEWQTQQSASPPFVFALSLGAMVTLQWARRFPGELAGAVLVNTSLRGINPFYRRMSPGAYARLARIFLERNDRVREKHVLELTSQHRDWEQSVFKQRAEIQKKHPVSRSNAFRQILAALSPLESESAPELPVLLLNSLGDQLVHPDCSKEIAQAWNVPLKRHAWAGHDLPLDDPEWTLRTVKEWLDAFPQSSSKARKAKS